MNGEFGKKLSGWTTYNNEEYGIRVDYPEDWQEVYPSGCLVGFVNRSAGSFAENFNIVIQLCLGMNLEQFIAYNRKSISHFYPDTVITKELEIEVHGKKGYEWYFKLTYEGVTIQQKQVLFVSNNKGYILSCGALDSRYSILTDIFDEIISSIKISG